MIANPSIVSFSKDQMRRAADVGESLALTLETLVDRWDDWGLQAMYDAMSDEEKDTPIDDGAAEGGRQIYTMRMMANYIDNSRKLREQFNADQGKGLTLRKQLRYMATNPRNPLLAQ